MCHVRLVVEMPPMDGQTQCLMAWSKLHGAIKMGSPIVHHPSYREATKISSVLRSSE